MNWISFRVIVSAMKRFRNSGWYAFGGIVGLATGGRLIASWPESESLMRVRTFVQSFMPEEESRRLDSDFGRRCWDRMAKA